MRRQEALPGVVEPMRVRPVLDQPAQLGRFPVVADAAETLFHHARLVNHLMSVERNVNRVVDTIGCVQLQVENRVRAVDGAHI